MERIDRRPLRPGETFEVDLGPFDDVVSLDPGVLEIETLDQRTIRIRGLRLGQATLLVLRGGESIPWDVWVTTPDPREPYRFGDSGDGIRVHAEAFGRVQIEKDRPSTTTVGVSAGFDATDRAGLGWRSEVGAIQVGNAAQFTIAQVSGTGRWFDVRLGDGIATLGSPARNLTLRQAFGQVRVAERGRIRLDVGALVGGTRPAGCCAFFGPDADALVAGHGALRVGKSETLVRAGLMIPGGTRELLGMVGIEERISGRWGFAEAQFYQIGAGQRGTLGFRLGNRVFRQTLRISGSTPGTYDGARFRREGHLLGDARSDLTLARFLRVGGFLRYSLAGFTAGNAELGGGGLDLNASRGRFLFSASSRLDRSALLGDAASVQYILTPMLGFSRNEQDFSLSVRALTSYVLGEGMRSTQISGGLLKRVHRRWELGSRQLFTATRSDGSASLSGIAIYAARRVRAQFLAGAGARIKGTRVSPNLSLSGNGGWAVTRWLEVNGQAAMSLNAGVPSLTVGLGVRSAGRVGFGRRVRGRVFDDADLDGVLDPGELPVEGVGIQIGGQQTTSGANGRYLLTGLEPKEQAMEIQSPGYRPLDPSPRVEVRKGRTVRRNVAVSEQHRVDVRVYVDRNADGTYQPGEPLVPANRVTLTSPQGTRSAAAPEGVASFEGDLPEAAEIILDPFDIPEGYLPVGDHRVAVDLAASSRTLVSLMVRPQRSLRAKVCDDANGNGRVDLADPCPAGREVRLSDGRTTTTDGAGSFFFSELPEGQVEVTCAGCETFSMKLTAAPWSRSNVVLLAKRAPVEDEVIQASESPLAALRVAADEALKVGQRVPFEVTGTRRDLTQFAVTDADVRFDPPGVVRRFGSLLVALRPGVTEMVVAKDKILSPPKRLVVESLPVVGLTASPNRLELAASDVQPLDVRAVYIDGDIAPVTDELTWTSDRPDIARVEGNGVVVAVSPGRALVRGSYLSVSTNPIEVRVTAGATVNKIAITPETLVLGLESRGRMYVDATLTTGRRMQLASDVQWFVEDASIVSVEEGGRIQPKNIGRTTIYARYGGLQTPRAQIEVVPAVGLLAQPTFGAIPVGGTTALKAVEVLQDGSFREQPRARWRSSDDTIATIVGSTLTAHAPGTVQVVATHRDRESLPLSVEVLASEVVELTLSPEVVEVAADDPGYVDAMAHFRNGRSAVVSNAATWSIGDPRIARVDDEGVVTGVKPGRTLLMATWMGVESEPIPVIVGTAVATVANAVIVEPASVSISAQGSQELAVSVLSETGHILRSKGVRWEVADPSVAWVEGGVVKAVSVGSTTITAIHGDVRSLPVSVQVNPIVGVNAAPALGRLPVGARVDLKAIGVVDDGTLEDLSRSGAVKWTSSDPRVLRIDEDGKLLAFTAGRATVTAQWRNLKTQAMRVDVADVDLASITLDPQAASVRVSETLPLAAVAVFGDGQVADATPHVTWTTTRPEVASVDDGLLQGLSPGAAEVFASWMGVDSDTVRVTVAVADAVGVILGNASEVLLSDARIPLRATAITTDGKLLDASQQTTWRVGDTDVVRVDANGYLEARSPGTTTVAGEVGGFVSPEVQVEVAAATLIRLEISPGALAVGPDDAVELAAHGELDDGRRIEVSPQITWEIEGHGVIVDRYNRLIVEPGASARVRARHGEVRSPWAQIVATE